MIPQNRLAVDGGEEKTALKSIPYGLAETCKIIRSRIKGVMLVDQENKYDDRKEERQYKYAV
jgi:hypothetical protein